MDLRHEGRLNGYLRDMTTLGGTVFTTVLIMGAFAIGRSDFAIPLLLTFVFNYPLIGAVRTLHYRERPKPESYAGRIGKIDAGSFPSIHATNSFYVAYVLGSATGTAGLAFFYAVAFAVCYTRYYFGKHHLSDLVAGALLGTVTSYAVVTYLV